jgi:hypothetical protein
LAIYSWLRRKGPATGSKKRRGFGKIVSEFFIDRRTFQAKIPHRFKEIISTKNTK